MLMRSEVKPQNAVAIVGTLFDRISSALRRTELDPTLYRFVWTQQCSVMASESASRKIKLNNPS